MLKVGQDLRFKLLEQENSRLERAVADLTLDKLILNEAEEGRLATPENRCCYTQHF